MHYFSPGMLNLGISFGLIIVIILTLAVGFRVSLIFLCHFRGYSLVTGLTKGQSHVKSLNNVKENALNN